MKPVIGKSWRDAATLIVLSRSAREVSRCRDICNYDILLQTRTQKASFKNSVVFPGGATEAADGSPEWLQLLRSFGYTNAEFEALHRPGAPVTPVFQNNPIQRHISLRITAIRETFEELGLLICSRTHRKDRSGVWASIIADVDIKYWQNQVANNPEELLNLCKELGCYPDIWALYYWSNWRSPARIPKKFDTAFFITALDGTPSSIEGNTEVAKVEWSNPLEILVRNSESKVILYPPQSYELNRLSHWLDLEELAKFASSKSPSGSPLFYHATVKAKDGKLLVLPGDELYPTDIDYTKHTVIETDKTVSELRSSSQTAHRIEFEDSKSHLVIKNYSFLNNMDMDEKVIPVHLTIY